MLLHECNYMPGVAFASERSVPDTYFTTQLQSEQENLNKMEGRFETKSEQIDRHLESTDARLNDLSNRISTIQGIGTGVLGVLGVLQILGFITSRKEG
jgi:hypothetical protein